ncbi:cold-shock protein, DNA-binding protein [[Leptolyngbya] sp. PCC 7376]|nr:cold-shock protein, DNA-binding protein [[Leptolyngbya] sp. PCC 7376]
MRIYTLFRDGYSTKKELVRLPFQVTAISDTEALFKGKMLYPKLHVSLSKFAQD